MSCNGLEIFLVEKLDLYESNSEQGFVQNGFIRDDLRASMSCKGLGSEMVLKSFRSVVRIKLSPNCIFIFLSKYPFKCFVYQKKVVCSLGSS
jgi:hypothetical protein